MRRLAYLIVALLWIVLMTLPILAFVLAARGEVMIGDDQSSNIRVFMVNDGQLEGIGLQRVQKARSKPGCFRTSVNYLLWEGQSTDLNTSFCQCYSLETGYLNTDQTCDDE